MASAHTAWPEPGQDLYDSWLPDALCTIAACGVVCQFVRETDTKQVRRGIRAAVRPLGTGLLIAAAMMSLDFVVSLPLQPPDQEQITADKARLRPAAFFAGIEGVVVWTVAYNLMGGKRRRGSGRGGMSNAQIPRLHSPFLAHFELSANLVYAQQVHKVASALITNPPYVRPTRDKDRTPTPYYGGRFNNDKDARTWIVDERKSKSEHVKKGKAVHLPTAAERAVLGGHRGLEADCKAAIKFTIDNQQRLPSWRRQQVNILQEVIDAVEPLNKSIRAAAERLGAPEHVRHLTGPVVLNGDTVRPGVNFALMCVLCDAIRWPDDKLVFNMAMGFPVVGHLEDSGVYKPIDPEHTPEKFEELMSEVQSGNLEWLYQVESKLKSSALKCREAAQTGGEKSGYQATCAVIDATLKEVQNGFTSPGMTQEELINKFTDANGVFHCRILPRYGIWQGTKWCEETQKEIPKLRCIDNGLSSGTNAMTELLETIITPSFSFPADVAHEMCKYCDEISVPVPPLNLGLDDLFAAYRRIPNSQLQYTTVAVFHYNRNQVLYHSIYGHPFGLKASVVNFNRMPHALCSIAARLFAVVTTHFVDDYITVDINHEKVPDISVLPLDQQQLAFQCCNHMSAQQCLDLLHSKVGLHLEPKKRKYAASRNVLLGVHADMSRAHSDRVVVFRPTTDRMRRILTSMQEARKEDRLKPHDAQVLLGKLNFCLQAGAGRIGRAATLPLVERASQAYNVQENLNSAHRNWRHVSTPTQMRMTCRKRLPESVRNTFNPGLHLMVEFFEKLFDDFPDLHVRVGHHEEDHVLVYTDASDSPDHSGMGIVIIDKKNNTKYVSECIVPPEFIAELRKDRSAIINHLELLAIQCAFNTFGDILRSRKVLFFGDNTSSLSAVVHGYSSSPELGRLANATHMSMAELKTDVFFAYVPTDANVADIPSRARTAREPADWAVLKELDLINEAHSRQMVLPPIHVLSMEGLSM